MYKLFKMEEWEAVIRTTDGACIPFAEANTDYQEYLKFLAEGGKALPADEPVGE